MTNSQSYGQQYVFNIDSENALQLRVQNGALKAFVQINGTWSNSVTIATF